MLFLWWQYLQLRYMLDSVGHIKAVFTSIDERIVGLLGMSFFPNAAMVHLLLASHSSHTSHITHTILSVTPRTHPSTLWRFTF
jgi:hypothetical protein